MMRRRLLAGSAALAVVGTAGCIGVGGSLDHHQAFETTVDDPVQSTAVETTVGDIDVHGEERTNVHIEGEKLASREADLDDMVVVTAVTDGRLRVAVDDSEVDNTFFWLETRPSPDITVELRVPAGVHVDTIETVTCDVNLSEVSGPVAVDGTTSDVDLTAIDGPVDIEVTTGDVDLEAIAGNLDVETTTGNISVRDVVGDVSVETTTGDIDVDGIDGDLAASTTTGSIEVGHVTGDVSTG